MWERERERESVCVLNFLWKSHCLKSVPLCLWLWFGVTANVCISVCVCMCVCVCVSKLEYSNHTITSETMHIHMCVTVKPCSPNLPRALHTTVLCVCGVCVCVCVCVCVQTGIFQPYSYFWNHAHSYVCLCQALLSKPAKSITYNNALHKSHKILTRCMVLSGCASLSLVSACHSHSQPVKSIKSNLMAEMESLIALSLWARQM